MPFRMRVVLVEQKALICSVLIVAVAFSGLAQTAISILSNK